MSDCGFIGYAINCVVQLQSHSTIYISFVLKLAQFPFFFPDTTFDRADEELSNYT